MTSALRQELAAWELLRQGRSPGVADRATLLSAQGDDQDRGREVFNVGGNRTAGPSCLFSRC